MTVTNQLATFYIGQENYGIEIDYVQEIIRMPQIVHLPKAPDHIEGLANLRSNILAIINGRRKFGLPRADYTDETRVAVLDFHGYKLGYVVDRVSDVITVNAEEIEEITADKDYQKSFLKGVAKLNNGQRLVMIIDPAYLFGQAEKDIVTSDGGQVETEENTRRNTQVTESQAATKIEEFVNFRVAREDYAIPIAHVQEIVHVPSVINRVPNAPEYVEGLISLRNRILPIVNIRSLYGLEQSDFDERSRIVVVKINHSGQILNVGLAVDAVNEVLRISSEAIAPVPDLLRTKKTSEITGVCKSKNQSLVYILDPTRLFSLEEMVEFTSENVDSEQEIQSTAQSSDEEQLVTFWLESEEFAASINQVQEIIRVPQVVRVPKAPSYVEGVINIRGSIIPVIDLRTKFNLPQYSRDEQSRVVVINLDGQRTGLIVDSAREVAKISCANIEPVPEMLDTRVDTAFIQGVGKLAGGQRMVIILDMAKAILADDGGASGLLQASEMN